MSLGQEVMILYAVTNGYLDDVPVDKIVACEQKFHEFMKSSHPDIEQRINTDYEMKSEVEEALKRALEEFKQTANY